MTIGGIYGGESVVEVMVPPGIYKLVIGNGLVIFRDNISLSVGDILFVNLVKNIFGGYGCVSLFAHFVNVCVDNLLYIAEHFPLT